MRNACRGLVSAALALSTLAASAEAADLGPYPRRNEWRGPQPAYTPAAFRWTGFYAGVQAGYGWGNVDAASTFAGGFVTDAFSYGTDGGVGGVHAGYNWQTGQFVFGLETDIEVSGISGSGAGTLGGGHRTDIDWLGSFRGRIGYAAGNTLFYATGGLAYGGIEVNRSIAPGISPFVTGSDWNTGWTLGGGIEHAIASNISLRLEYRYTDLGQISFTEPLIGMSDKTDVTQSAVRAGLSFRF